MLKRRVSFALQDAGRGERAIRCLSHVTRPGPGGPRDFFVPFEEKDEAKIMGARWNGVNKVWYAPDEIVASRMSMRWRQIDARPLFELAGEDRAFGGDLLYVDLVPKTCWFSNARTNIHGADWKRVRQLVASRVDNTCECCGSGGVDVHERWQFDPESTTQTLRRLILMCKACHLATHMGFARVSGRADHAFAHLRVVRNFTDAEAEKHVTEAFALWSDRSRFHWDLDLSILNNSGIECVQRQ